VRDEGVEGEFGGGMGCEGRVGLSGQDGRGDGNGDAERFREGVVGDCLGEGDMIPTSRVVLDTGIRIRRRMNAVFKGRIAEVRGPENVRGS
jgi:hypothetical protein